MIPRKRLDIGWGDLLFGMAQCLIGNDREAAYAACRESTTDPASAAFFLSVRSGFDAVLGALAFPPGSQILIHAITNPDMLEIVKAHGLVPVPVDVDPQTLCPDFASLERGVRDKTVGLLVTHLFGGRMPMEAIAQWARQRGLLVFEDCAQGYWGDGFTGHPASAVCMFSFGPIKHSTALGGGLFFIRDSKLRDKVDQLHATYAVQSRWLFGKRLAKYCAVLFLDRPGPYTVVCAGCRLLGKSHDALSYLATRGFAGGQLLEKLRKQASTPLLILLAMRFQTDALARVNQQRQVAEAFRARIPQVCSPGHGKDSSHWLFAIRVANARELCERLWEAGFDAHLWPVSLCVVPPVAEVEGMVPRNALDLSRQLLFLPVYPKAGERRLVRMAELICRFADKAPVPFTVPLPASGGIRGSDIRP